MRTPDEMDVFSLIVGEATSLKVTATVRWLNLSS
jgi:hypothetical protein